MKSTDSEKIQYILIFGAGGHGIVVADILSTRLPSNTEYIIRGFVDGNQTKKGQTIGGNIVLGDDNCVQDYPDDRIIIAVGDNKTRKKISEAYEKKRFHNAVHCSSTLSSSAVIGVGCMICAGVIVNPEATIGNHVILNTGCTIDHHNQISDFCHIAPGTHLGGEVKIGEGVLIGLGSAVLPGVTIGEWSMIGAGSVVNKDIPHHSLAYGNPVKIIRKLEG